MKDMAPAPAFYYLWKLHVESHRSGIAWKTEYCYFEHSAVYEHVALLAFLPKCVQST